MLIEINTLIYIDSAIGYQPLTVMFINSDKIVDVQPNEKRGVWIIDAGTTDNRYVVSNAEWDRIKPLLVISAASPSTAPSAPQPIDPAPVDDDWWSRFWELMAQYNLSPIEDADKAGDELENHVRTYRPAGLPATPAYHALYDAYKKAVEASNWQDTGLILYPHVAYFLTGVTPKMPASNQDQYNRGLYPTGPIQDAYLKYLDWLKEDRHESEYDMRNTVIDAVANAMPKEHIPAEQEAEDDE